VADIKSNLAQVRERIEMATQRAGRDPGSVRLVAISKGHPVDAIRLAYAAGVTEFGENRAREGRNKVEELRTLAISWHFVGHLQSNKVKYVLGTYQLLHSLDRMSLATEIDKRARRASIVQPCLVQVNVSGEESKFGLPPGEVGSFLDRVSKLGGVKVEGLMMIAPLVDDPEEARPFFRRLRELAEELRPRLPPTVSLSDLSMGMTNDYEVAVEEGATIVRIGRAIFGERQ